MSNNDKTGAPTSPAEQWMDALDQALSAEQLTPREMMAYMMAAHRSLMRRMESPEWIAWSKSGGPASGKPCPPMT
jgi:hypothetical protein